MTLSCSVDWSTQQRFKDNYAAAGLMPDPNFGFGRNATPNLIKVRMAPWQRHPIAAAWTRPKLQHLSPICLSNVLSALKSLVRCGFQIYLYGCSRLVLITSSLQSQAAGQAIAADLLKMPSSMLEHVLAHISNLPCELSWCLLHCCLADYGP